MTQQQFYCFIKKKANHHCRHRRHNEQPPHAAFLGFSTAAPSAKPAGHDADKISPQIDHNRTERPYMDCHIKGQPLVRPICQNRQQNEMRRTRHRQEFSEALYQCEPERLAWLNHNDPLRSRNLNPCNGLSACLPNAITLKASPICEGKINSFTSAAVFRICFSSSLG